MQAPPRSRTLAARLGRFAVWAVCVVCPSWLLGCSALVDPESLVVKCEPPIGVTEDDPCIEVGMHCVAGTCQPCEGAREDCNGVDDDCDGRIDEGHDQDGDHYTWCGGGVPALADCVPTDPTIHPSATGSLDDEALGVATELCDGKDNDCDGNVDESPECEPGQSCTETGCLSGQYCDAPSGRCITPRPVGSGCTADSECEAGFCLDPGVFAGGGDARAKRCASACCSDAECEPSSVCEIAENGVRACVPADIAGRGDAAEGADCSRDSDCATGECLRDTCRSRCRTDSDCEGETNTCVLATGGVGDSHTWVCGGAAGRGDAREPCTGFDPTACKSAWCQETNCAAPCGSTADCLSGERCAAIEVSSIVPPVVSLASMCQPTGSSTDTDLICCDNSDCPPTQLCKPKAMGQRFTMTCQGGL